MSLRCRLAKAKDNVALADMRWRLQTDDAPITDQASYDDFITAFLAARMGEGNPNHLHWLVETGPRVVGVMTLVLVDKVPAPGDLKGRWGYVTNAYVYPDARNAGAGGQLLEAIKAWATDQTLELLIVWPSDRARPFYERSGFESRRDPLVLDLTGGGDS